jgi:hypothetical protein
MAQAVKTTPTLAALLADAQAKAKRLRDLRSERATLSASLPTKEAEANAASARAALSGEQATPDRTLPTVRARLAEIGRLLPEVERLFFADTAALKAHFVSQVPAAEARLRAVFENAEGEAARALKKYQELKKASNLGPALRHEDFLLQAEMLISVSDGFSVLETVKDLLEKFPELESSK